MTKQSGWYCCNEKKDPFEEPVPAKGRLGLWEWER